MRPMGRGRGIPIQIEIDPASGAGSSQAHSELGSGGLASASQVIIMSIEKKANFLHTFF